MAKKRKTPARGAGGRFKKAGSTALTRRAPAAPKRRRRAAPTAVARRRRRVGGSGGGGMVATLKSRIKPLLASSLYAYVAAGDGKSASNVRGYLSKVPTLDAIGVPASHGLLAAFIASRTSGQVRMAFDLLSVAALHRAAWNLGASGFEFEKATKIAGDGNDYGGEIGADEADAYDRVRGDEDDDLAGDEE